jgi:hypothetical protein
LDFFIPKIRYGGVEVNTPKGPLVLAEWEAEAHISRASDKITSVKDDEPYERILVLIERVRSLEELVRKKDEALKIYADPDRACLDLDIYSGQEEYFGYIDQWMPFGTYAKEALALTEGLERSDSTEQVGEAEGRTTDELNTAGQTLKEDV